MLDIHIPMEQRQHLIRNIQSYVDTEWSESIGELAALNLLDFAVKQLGPIIYNQAVKDARNVVMQQMERADEELYALERPMDLLRRD